MSNQGRPPRPLYERFWAKVRKTDECWWWTAGGTRGYGVIWSLEARRHLKAHRVSWEWAYGPIPDGLTVDHLCMNTLCVRPDHLRLLTASKNAADAAARRVPKTRCKRGHDLTLPNAKIEGRKCRECANLRRRERYRAYTFAITQSP